MGLSQYLMGNNSNLFCKSLNEGCIGIAFVADFSAPNITLSSGKHEGAFSCSEFSKKS